MRISRDWKKDTKTHHFQSIGQMRPRFAIL